MQPDMSEKEKVIFIGLDGATWDIIEPMTTKGYLPTFKKIMNNGVICDLISTEPLLSPSIWTSMVTGKLPGKHGIVDFFATGEYVKCKRVWEILMEKGYKIGLFNFFFTYPPQTDTLFTVPLETSSGLETHPKELKFLMEMRNLARVKDLSLFSGLKYTFNALLSGVKIQTLINGFFTYAYEKLNNTNFLNTYYIKKRLELSLHSEVFIKQLKRKHPDFAVFYNNIIDSISHFYWQKSGANNSNQLDIVSKCYIDIDKALGRIYNSANEGTNFIIASDHGFQSGDAESLGYVRTETLLRKLMLDNDVYGTNMAVTAYIRPKRVNLDRQEKPHTLAQLKSKFEGVKIKEDGERVFDVRIINDEYITLNVRRANLLSSSMNVIVGDTITPLEDLIIRTGRIIGAHHPRGILLMSGKNIKKSERLPSASALDITPTILYLLTLEVARDMDGRVIETAFKDEFSRKNPIKFVNTYETDHAEPSPQILTEQEEDKIKERLRGLGYLE